MCKHVSLRNETSIIVNKLYSNSVQHARLCFVEVYIIFSEVFFINMTPTFKRWSKDNEFLKLYEVNVPVRYRCRHAYIEAFRNQLYKKVLPYNFVSSQ